MTSDVLQSLAKAVIDGETKKACDLANEALKAKLPAIKIIKEGLVPGLQTVGEYFGTGEYYLPELLVSSEAMQSAMDLVTPLLADQGDSFHIGNYVIGSVKGDIHDIGKNIVIAMLKGNGWNVTDLGVDVSSENFVKALKGGNYDILGLSTLLTVTMPAAGETISAIREAGLREKIKIMVGGAPVTQGFAEKIGADEFALDAWEAVTKAKALIDAA